MKESEEDVDGVIVDACLESVLSLHSVLTAAMRVPP